MAVATCPGPDIVGPEAQPPPEHHEPSPAAIAVLAADRDRQGVLSAAFSVLAAPG